VATIFGDFVFKITAPVTTAIKNLQNWDKEVGKTGKQLKEFDAKFIMK